MHLRLNYACQTQSPSAMIHILGPFISLKIWIVLLARLDYDRSEKLPHVILKDWKI